MHQIPSVEQFLVIFQAVVSLGLALRIWFAKLARTYPYFFCFMVANVVETGILLNVSFMTNTYRNVFVVFEILTLSFYVLLVQEVYGAVLTNLRGLATISRRFIVFSVVAAILVSIAVIAFSARPPVTITGKLFVFHQGLMSTLLLFVLAMSAYLVYFPVSLKRNVVIYSIGFAVYFLAEAATLYLRNHGAAKPGDRWMSTFLLSISIGSLAFWLIGLSRRGEQARAVVGHRWNRADEARILQQLQMINETVLKKTHQFQDKNT